MSGLLLPPWALGNEELWADNTNFELNLMFHLPLPFIVILLLLLKVLIILNNNIAIIISIYDDFCLLGASGMSSPLP